MLHIYRGRENLNKDKFIYDNAGEDVLFIVPEQYTLQAERDALFYLHTNGLLDKEVLSFSRLGARILDEAGGAVRSMINKNGRHMILSKLMRDHEADLKVYGRYAGNTEFINMLNDFISQMKQYEVTPDLLSHLIELIPKERDKVKGKLEDVLLIYKGYEESIEGKYTDSEDLVELQAQRAANCEFLNSKTAWIYGFDSLTPNNDKLIKALLENCPDVNIVLTGTADAQKEKYEEEIFKLADKTAERLKGMASDLGIKVSTKDIPKDYERKDLPQGLKTLERELFRTPAEVSSEEAGGEGIEIVKASNYYSEAETVASKVQTLIREKGYRYKDIILICNDLTTRGSIYKRVFSQYDMDLYVDKKRTLTHSPAIRFAVNLLRVIADGYKRQDVILLLKTNMTEFSPEDTEIFEKYCKEYFIEGSKFKKPFEKGKDDYGDDLARIEEIRAKLIGSIMEFSENFKKDKSAAARSTVLFEYLKDEAGIPERTNALIDEQMEMGRPELAAESAQVWNSIVSILDQIAMILGDATISQDDYCELFISGIQSLEIGLLPPTPDSLVLGTMERTRCGAVKAIFVMGANEGVLPKGAETQDILTEEEKEFLTEKADMPVCKQDSLKSIEEEAAIYRNMTKATELLCISMPENDYEGLSVKPSPIYQKISEMFSGLEEQVDVENTGSFADVIGGRTNTLNHIGAYMKGISDAEKNEKLPPEVGETLIWYAKHEKERLKKIAAGLSFDNSAKQLENGMPQKLFIRGNGDVYSLSPSRLEMYAKCPFEHFIKYGLHPQEARRYEVRAFDLGDVYHEVMQKLVQRLTKDGVKVTAPSSPWMTATNDEIRDLAEEIAGELIAEYKEGMMSEEPVAKYRASRLKDMVRQAADMLISQARLGRIESIATEERFGRGKDLAEIRIPLEGNDAVIEGIIDRVDYLPGDKVKVIDYKSKNEKYSTKEALSGWKLQLFIYMKAASEDKEPVGAFYFHMDNPIVGFKEAKIRHDLDTKEGKQELRDALRGKFRLDGFMLNREDVIEDFVGKDPEKAGTVAPLTRKKDGTYKKTDRLLDEEEFEELTSNVGKKVREIVSGIAEGKIDISPLRNNTRLSACTYCDYRSICKFDTSFYTCKFREM